MTKTEYETHYRDTLKTAERVASYLRIPRVATVLTATEREHDKTVQVFNHYAKRLPGLLTFHEANMMLQDFGKRLSDAELKAGLWSREGVEIADGYRMRDVEFVEGTEPRLYEPLAASPTPQPNNALQGDSAQERA